MSYSAPPPSPYQMPEPGPAPRRGKPWLLIIGGLVLLLSLVLCTVGGVMTVQAAGDLADAPVRTGSHTVVSDGSEAVTVWAPKGEGTRCEVTGPSGPVTEEETTALDSVAAGDSEYEYVTGFTTDEAGDYVVSCSGPFVVSEFSMTGAIIALVGGSLCCLGVVLAGIGLLLWLIRRKR
ncbi:hypothetical protein JNO54_02780 [Janibacter sp. YIM B02568]|uniref:hypothetical protein n=1 Tax=Janibacter endophyticus TaxID=2806261 RepID=UPI00194DE043|nr:hypothetical protein [Janibacter endophyticus]MBM6545065.1 hypothetical protein [Janibacter endophyticus]